MIVDEEQPQAEPGSAGAPAAGRLMVSGWIQLGPAGGALVEVRRLMVLVGTDGAALGQVAAVVVAGPEQTVTHLVLGRQAPELEYRLAPIALVERVDEGSIHLRLTSGALTTLPRRPAG